MPQPMPNSEDGVAVANNSLAQVSVLTLTSPRELLGHIRVQPIGEAEEECFSLRN